MARQNPNKLLLLSLAVIFNLAFNLDAGAMDGEPVEPSSQASQGRSLRLVGTALAGEPEKNLAVIEDRENSRQLFFHEGERVYGILIKKILRDRIIVDAGQGDEVIKLKSALVGDASPLITSEPADQPLNIAKKKGARYREITLARETVESVLSDIDQTLANVNISSGGKYNHSTGFRISSFESGSIFSLIGLQNNDLILSANDQKMIGSDRAKAFLEKIRAGGNLDFKVRRRARTHHIHLSIE